MQKLPSSKYSNQENRLPSQKTLLTHYISSPLSSTFTKSQVLRNSPNNFHRRHTPTSQTYFSQALSQSRHQLQHVQFRRKLHLVGPHRRRSHHGPTHRRTACPRLRRFPPLALESPQKPQNTAEDDRVRASCSSEHRRYFNAYVAESIGNDESG